jgi:hypothetical protein
LGFDRNLAGTQRSASYYLRAIERVFDSVDKQPARKRTVKSLTYCREEIEAQYAEWLEMQIGKNGAGKSSRFKVEVQSSQVSELSASKNDLFADETIVAHLENVSIELKPR